MAILHGSWIQESQESYFFIWGETWRHLSQVAVLQLEDELIHQHPYGMTLSELKTFLLSLKKSGLLNWQLSELGENSETAPKSPRRRKSKNQEMVVSGEVSHNQSGDLSKERKSVSRKCVLPTRGETSNLIPCYSALSEKEENQPIYLYPWQVEGICLKPLEAFDFLQSLPLGSITETESFLGSDLRFWSQVGRWCLDLFARGKFLPTLKRISPDKFSAKWEPLLDSSTDQIRFNTFAKQMPIACRIYQREESQDSLASAELYSPWRVEFPSPSQDILKSFLTGISDAQVRKLFHVNTEIPLKNVTAPVGEWLQALGNEIDIVEGERAIVERLEIALKAWKSPLQHTIEKNEFRTCFNLIPPLLGKTEWTLMYGLHAIDDGEFMIDAQTIWHNPVERLNYLGRMIQFPQETLLKGLGLASKLYPLIEPSLQEAYPQSCQLNALQAYEFLKSVAWRFTDSGLGVILPPSLTNREGWASRLGLSIQADTTPLSVGKMEKLGLKSILNFKWELTIGGQQISQKEFKRLVALNSPLVEINGEWVELRPQDVRAAQNFFVTRKEEMTLSLEDALRLAAGDTPTIEKLPVVNFAASGQLQELLNTLTNNESIDAIAPPKSFRGELRPYQARGVHWLSFLEKWGLGACLADDMGCGKCLTPESLIFVNGNLEKAETIWHNYAKEETLFDGEGFWSEPKTKLLVNSLDQKTNKIVQAPIQRLYRQEVREKLRKITLEDGSIITITNRHKLLIRNEWTTDFSVGDYVGLPAKLSWDGESQDPDLVKFLAWQIALGDEMESGTLTIAQKDDKNLADLDKTIQHIAERYNLKINHPSNSNKIPVFRVNSPDYRRFLAEKGYQWGTRSRDKSIPAFIMQADVNTVRIFLSHYFDAEASVIIKMGQIEINTASPLLMQQISTLLRRFGIKLRVASQEKCATNGSHTYYIGTLGGSAASLFLQEIGFNSPENAREFEEICRRLNLTNVEEILTSDIVAYTVENSKLPLSYVGMHHPVYLNGSQQFSRPSLANVITEMPLFKGATPKESPQGKPFEAYANLAQSQLEHIRQSWQDIGENEVVYSPIKTIEEIDYQGWVYDFEVSEYHNFIANNILCHNTIQLIAFLLHLQEENALTSPVLLVCPTSVLGNWKREVNKFGPTLKAFIHHGNQRAKGKEFAKAIKGKNLVITSYPLVFRDLKEFEGVKWQGIVLDEAQNIKNSEAKQSQAVRQIEASFRIALTGTPVENRLQELWSILDFLNPGFLGNRNFFQRRFAVPIEKYGDRDSLQTLRALVRPFILRRLKTDKDIIQDLPEKQEMTVFCPLSQEQAILYQKLVEESLAEIESSDGIKRRGMILALLTRLKQVCNHPLMLKSEGSDKKTDRKKVLKAQDSGKLLRLQEMLEEVFAERDRALIFTQFAEWGHLLKPYLEQHFGKEILFLYGGTRQQQREEMIDRFQHDPQGPPIMILSLKAGGTGLNLTRATHVFHFDRWWNPAVENQATDRVFRIGQTRNVQVHKFVCTGTLEEKIHDMIESKKALAEQVVSAGEQWLTELDTDQLRNLLLLDRSSIIEDDED